MTTTPLVSVVMPMRNAAPWIEDAVASILGQSMSDFELVVVDDGSDDKSASLVEKAVRRDARVRLLGSTGHGIVDALNAGVEASRGRYVARMDADDVAIPSRLERQVALLAARPEVGVVGGQMECSDLKGRVQWRTNYPLDDRSIRAMITEANPFAAPTVIFRRELFDKTGGYREICRYAEDFDLWCRLLDHCDGANLADVVVRYRVHLGQSTLGRSYQQTLSSLAVRAANPLRIATGEDPLSEYQLATEQAVFDLGVPPEIVRLSLVESALVVARHTRTLGDARLARRIVEDAAALCAQGALPEGRSEDIRKAILDEALVLGLSHLSGPSLASPFAPGRERVAGLEKVSPKASSPAEVDDSDEWWKADLELSIWSWHANEMDTGRRACERLLAGLPLPPSVEAAARANQTFYTPLLSDWIDGVTFNQLSVTARDGWPTFNPSIAGNGKGLHAIVRSVNYRLDEEDRYEMLEPVDVFLNENYFVSLDRELRVLTSEPLREPPGRADAVSGYPVRGYEDCRLFTSDRGLHAIASVRDRTAEGWSRMVLLDLEDGRVVRETPLASPFEQRDEKNWVPFSAGALTCLVYSWEPTVVLVLDLSSGEWKELSRRTGSGLHRDTRGGTPGLAVGNSWLFLVHENVGMPDWRRRYPHRFVLLGDDLGVKARSRPFFFLERTIEFAAGLAAEGDDLLISFGVKDSAAWCARVTLASVLERLDSERAASR